MRRTKTHVLVPIKATRCGSCALLEETVIENTDGKLVEGYRCPKNRMLPPFIEPYFGEKCTLYRPKTKTG